VVDVVDRQEEPPKNDKEYHFPKKNCPRVRCIPMWWRGKPRRGGEESARTLQLRVRLSLQKIEHLKLFASARLRYRWPEREQADRVLIRRGWVEGARRHSSIAGAHQQDQARGDRRLGETLGAQICSAAISAPAQGRAGAIHLALGTGAMSGPRPRPLADARAEYGRGMAFTRRLRQGSLTATRAAIAEMGWLEQIGGHRDQGDTAAIRPRATTGHCRAADQGGHHLD